MASFDSLDETFNTKTEEQLPVLKKKAKAIRISDKSEDKEVDYQYARAQLIDIVEKMQESLHGAMEVAEQSDHPRAYEVVFNGAKNAAEVVEKIGDLHKKMDDMDKDETKITATNVQNNMFLGSTAELMKMLKENNK